MYFVFDTETTGIPNQRNCKYSDDSAYESCRIVSIAWIILSDTFEVVSESYHLIRPDGYVIPEDATQVHGISQEHALLNGVPFTDIVAALLAGLHQCTDLVAHNISFDFGVVLHELHTCGNYRDVISKMFSMKRTCTMLEGRKTMGVGKFPKLIELYMHYFGKAPEESMHNALVDTRCCYECFKKINGETRETQPFTKKPRA
jgi:DNA polymerase III epsilon subunit-like protein